MPVTARTGRMDASRSLSRLLTLAVLSALALSPALALAQTEPAATAPAGAPFDMSRTTAPATAPSAPTLLLPPTATTTPPAHTTTAAPVPAMEIGNVTQPFTGRITADRVYIRSGPGSAYYEMGQLSKGDTIEVVGSRLGWYQILPPNGTFCMVAKDFVDADLATHTGTVKADYVNVRAGTALSKREPSAVLTVIRKGTKLDILGGGGATDKYYQIAPPEKAYVYISPQFVHQDPSAEYKVPNLKLPPGAVGPARDTVTAPTTLPSATTPPATVEIAPSSPTEAATTPPTTPEATATTEPAKTVVVPPQPSPTFNASAYDQFSELNKRYQAELQKPPMQRDYEPLLKDYKALAASPNIPGSVAQGTESRITALEKLAAIQRLARENATSTDAMAAQQKALQEQYSQAEKAIADYEQTGPYLAQGRLQTSAAVEGKYALVNPASGRVVAYVDPQSQIDISSLLGKFIGVRGTTHQSASGITVISVKNATLLPEPVTH
ncbi:MAG TPA: SH3 domain-containing protein [Phycisphaerae bacterium]|nr:SH3 domain-containing protein [Phycisphaerae bacterium]